MHHTEYNPVKMHRAEHDRNRGDSDSLDAGGNARSIMGAGNRLQEEPQRLAPRLEPRNNDSTAGMGHIRQSSTSSRQHPRPKRIACKECRQAKLRCEGLKGAGELCLRCRRLSLACQVDIAFRRVNKRLKINQLVDELEHLRTAIKEKTVLSSEQNPTQFHPSIPQQQLSTSLASTSSSPINTAAAIGNDSQVQTSHEADSPATAVNNGFPAGPIPESAQDMASPSFRESAPRYLKHVELTGRQIDELFAIFFQRYHCFLEILDPSTEPDMCYLKSPALFWTIITIAARRYSEDITLLGNLSPLVTSLVWSAAIQVPLPSYTIQALLLLATWRSPIDSQWKDPSLLYATVAKNAAMQNGLHRPEIVQDFLRVKAKLAPKDFQEAVKLWACCYIVAECVTTTAGQPSLFSEDSAIDRSCEEDNKYSLPRNLWYHLLIQRFLRRVNVTMARDTRSPSSRRSDKEGDGLMRLLECDFEELEQRFGDQISDIHRIALTMGRLQLRTYYFLEVCSPESRKQGLIRAYATALTLVSEVAKADAKTDFMIYAPTIVSLMLVTAGMLVIKMVHSTYDRYIDCEGGKQAFNVILGLLRRCGLEDNDTSGRATKILAQLWTLHREHRKEPSLNVKSRLGTNVLHDGLWTWREEFGGQGQGQGLSSLNDSPQATPAPPPLQTASTNTRSDYEIDLTRSTTAQLEQSYNQFFPAPRSNVYMNSLAEDISNLDWSWDVSCPSLLPDGIDSFQLIPNSYQTGNTM